MKNIIKQAVTISILWVCATTPATVLAESGSTAGTSGTEMSTSVRLKLRVIIPRFLQFQVGSAGTTADTLTFEAAPGGVGNGVAITGTGGDAAGGSGASVELRSNAGQVSIVADNDGGNGGLGSNGTISLLEITARSDSSDLPTPPLTDAGMASSKATLTGGDVTDRRATWSYEYRNSRTVEAGSYSAEIVYTAVSP